MSQWTLIIEICLPLPALLLALLFLPAPSSVRRGVLFLCDKVLSFHLFGGSKLIHVMLFLTGLALAGTSHQTWQTAKNAHFQLEEAGAISANVKLGILGPKWRQERNFWIAVLCFFSWVTLYRVYHIMLRKEELERIIRGHSGGGSRHNSSTADGKAPLHSSRADEPTAPPMPSAEEKKDN